MKHKEMFDDLADAIQKMIRRFPIDESFLYVNDIIITTLAQIEQNGICVDTTVFSKYFTNKPNNRGYVFSEYNIYTSTGRPSNRYGGVNYAALNHSDGSRRSFISRYGSDGRMVVVDYTAFHPRIICKLTNYNIPLEVDIYEYLAKLYFKKKTVDETDVANAKQLTFKQLYGGVDDRYSYIKYLSNLKDYITNEWNKFQKNGYIETPFFKRKITTDHIKDPSPTKIFNYILQATEGEIAIPRIQLVLDYLKNKKTKAILYIYDAVLYDFHKDDGLETLNEVRKIMSVDGAFPMKTYIGENYQDIKIVNI
jgi:DNA polymerase I-like protein with 3'-5' exonuclease and polymerase domains